VELFVKRLALLLASGVVVAGFGTAAGAAPALTVSGAARFRYETLTGPFQPGKGGSDHALTSRIGVAAELDLAPVVLGAELLDSRVYTVDEGGVLAAGDVNALEPIQAYATLQTGATAWTVGRFTQDLGSRRLIARSRSGNALSSFTGARGIWRNERGDSLTGLYVLPTIRQPLSRADTLDNLPRLDSLSDHFRLYGLFYTRRGLVPGADADAYVLRLTETDTPTRATRDRRITTMGVRLFRDPKAGAVDFDVEAVWQTGSIRSTVGALDVRDLDVAAAYLHAELGWSFSGAWKPRVELAYDHGSGDADPTDGDYGRFDGLFGSRRGDFGPGGLYGALSRSNVVAPVLRLEAAPGRWEGYVSYRPLWLAQARDSFGGTGVRDAAGRSGRFAGHQIEGRVRRGFGEHLLWEGGGAWLSPRGFLKRAPNATRQGGALYVYTDLTLSY
jgi:hypothetical protein